MYEPGVPILMTGILCLEENDTLDVWGRATPTFYSVTDQEAWQSLRASQKVPLKATPAESEEARRMFDLEQAYYR